MPLTAALTSGQSIGAYQLIEPAGTGGMAEVWRAYHPPLERFVAIKFLSPRYATDPTYLERFGREARAVSRLDHPNILTVYEYGEQDGWTYMVSPFIGGGTLAARLHRGPWSVADAVAVLEPLASALDHAHARGIVHRDLKPSNVLFTERGRLVLSDFGIARMLESSTVVSQVGIVVGTPLYMSPEQAEGKLAGPPSDRYSLGVVAYEMLTGRPPFTGATPLSLLRAHVDRPLPLPRTLNAALPRHVEATLCKALAKNPADRYPTASAFVEALRTGVPTVAEERTGSLALPSPPPRGSTGRHAVPASRVRTSMRVSRRDLLVGLGATIATSAVVGGLVWQPAGRSDGAPATTATPVARGTVTPVESAAQSPAEAPTSPPAPIPPTSAPAVATSKPQPRLAIAPESVDRLDGTLQFRHPVVLDADGLRFSPDSRLLVSVGITARLWRVSDRTPLQTFRPPGTQHDYVASIAFSGDGQTLAAGLANPDADIGFPTPADTPSHDRLLLWSVSDGALLNSRHPQQQGISTVAFWPNDLTLVAGSRYGIRLSQVTDAASERLIKPDNLRHYPLALSPDGQTLAAPILRPQEGPGKIGLVQASDSTVLHEIGEADANVWDLAFSPDGTMLIANVGSELRLWRVSDGSLVKKIGDGKGGFHSMAFSPDGQLLAVGTLSHAVHLYRVADQRLIRTLEGHAAPVNSVAFSPDGTLLATGDTSGAVFFWRAD